MFRIGPKTSGTEPSKNQLKTNYTEPAIQKKPTKKPFYSGARCRIPGREAGAETALGAPGVGSDLQLGPERRAAGGRISPGDLRTWPSGLNILLIFGVWGALGFGGGAGFVAGKRLVASEVQRSTRDILFSRESGDRSKKGAALFTLPIASIVLFHTSVMCV